MGPSVASPLSVPRQAEWEVTDAMLSCSAGRAAVTPVPRSLHTSPASWPFPDRVAWLRARGQASPRRMPPSCAAKSVQNAAYDKTHGSSFGRNTYTDHGGRGTVIAAGCSTTRHRAQHQSLPARPDGISRLRTGSATRQGELQLAESRRRASLAQHPRPYLRGLVAAMRARRRTHPARLEAARRLRSGQRQPEFHGSSATRTDRDPRPGSPAA
jgi:hypothetical protein